MNVAWAVYDPVLQPQPLHCAPMVPMRPARSRCVDRLASMREIRGTNVPLVEVS